MLFWPILGQCWCPAVTLVTLKRIQKVHKSFLKIQKKPLTTKIESKYLKKHLKIEEKKTKKKKKNPS